jgi:hypothetical protein
MIGALSRFRVPQIRQIPQLLYLRYLRRPAALWIVSSETLGRPACLSFSPTRRNRIIFGTAAWSGTPLGSSIALRARSSAGRLLGRGLCEASALIVAVSSPAVAADTRCFLCGSKRGGDSDRRCFLSNDCFGRPRELFMMDRSTAFLPPHKTSVTSALKSSIRARCSSTNGWSPCCHGLFGREFRQLKSGDPAENSNPISAAIDAAEEIRDPLEGLVETIAVDPGAPFAPDALERFAALKKADRAAFEALRAHLKKAGCRVTALDDAIAEENGEAGGRGLTQADILIELAQSAELPRPGRNRLR